MKNQTKLSKSSWLLVIGVVSMLALSGCTKTEEHPKKEHPATNPPAQK